jgi:rRNA maturation RNase YbeY
MPGTEQELGALVISMPTARRQAAGAGHSDDEELAVLLVHGLVHLLGFDHERGAAEARLMAELEMTLLSAAGVEPTLALTGRAL